MVNHFSLGETVELIYDATSSLGLVLFEVSCRSC